MSQKNTFTMYIDKVEYKDRTIGFNASTRCMGPHLIYLNDEAKTYEALIGLILGSHIKNPLLFPIDQLNGFIVEYSHKYQSVGKIRRTKEENFNTKHFRLIIPMESNEIRFFAHVIDSIGVIEGSGSGTGTSDVVA